MTGMWGCSRGDEGMTGCGGDFLFVLGIGWVVGLDMEYGIGDRALCVILF